MATDTVTRAEMTEALEEIRRVTMTETLRALGITLTAEMGQTLWRDGSQANDGQQPEPIIDVDKMADLLHDLIHNQEEMKATMGQSSHAPGLCDVETCTTCRDQRRAFAQKLAPQVEKATLAQAGSEIDLACAWAGLPQLSAKLSEVLAAFRANGSPGVEQAPEFGVLIEGVF